MDVARPYSSVAPTLEGDVLVALAATTQPLTGARVASLVRRGTERGVMKALDRLVEQGLVYRQPAGRAYLHTLNRDHIATSIVEGLATLRTEFLRRLREHVLRWQPAPAHASLFGSTARGDGDTTSDIDLLIVRPTDVDEADAAWREQIEQLTADAQAWTGNRASIIELAEAELRAPGPPVMNDIRRDAIDLAGTPIRALLKETE
jgi:nucleotidyltransferase-like protein